MAIYSGSSRGPASFSVRSPLSGRETSIPPRWIVRMLTRFERTTSLSPHAHSGFVTIVTKLFVAFVLKYGSVEAFDSETQAADGPTQRV
jgi:hypothetical protein